MEGFWLIGYVFACDLEFIMRFLYFSYDGMIDAVCCVGLRFACARSQFIFGGKVMNFGQHGQFQIFR